MMNERQPVFNSSFRIHRSSLLLPLPNSLAAVLVADGLLLDLAEGDLDERDDGRVVLLPALELQEVVIGAARAIRVRAADRGARVVDRAAARLLIQEHARLLEDHVLAAAQHPLAARPLDLRVTLLGRLRRQAEMFRQAFEVAPRDLYALVDRAAVGRALGAVEIDARLFVRNLFPHRFASRSSPYCVISLVK